MRRFSNHIFNYIFIACSLKVCYFATKLTAVGYINECTGAGLFRFAAS